MLQIAMFTVSPIQENTYLVYNEKGAAALVDPGCYFDEEKEQLAAFISEKNLQVKYLLQTHCHLDHVFGTLWAATTYQLLPCLHVNEQPVLDRAADSGLRWNLPFEAYTGPVTYLAEGDTITLGTDTLEVLYVPGHAPGHIAFYCRQQHFVLGGDVLFQRSIGRTDLPGAHHETLLNSIREKLFTLPDNTTVFPGHGPSTTVGSEKRNNPFL